MQSYTLKQSKLYKYIDLNDLDMGIQQHTGLAIGQRLEDKKADLLLLDVDKNPVISKDVEIKVDTNQQVYKWWKACEAAINEGKEFVDGKTGNIRIAKYFLKSNLKSTCVGRKENEVVYPLNISPDLIALNWIEVE